MSESDYERLYEETVSSVVSVYRDPGERGVGSGFVYDDGHVVTNDHVVRGNDRVEIRFSDDQWTTGTVVGSDTYTDLAVVSVPDRPADAVPLSIADEETLPTPGQPVAAIGNPFGLSGSVTTGIVSGVDRSMTLSGGFAKPRSIRQERASPIRPLRTHVSLTGKFTPSR